MNENAYEGFRRVIYDGDAQFVPVCVKCSHFVKADKVIVYTDYETPEFKPNATCAKCGRTHMIFEGFV